MIRFRESLRSLGHSSYYIYIYICALRGIYRYLRIHQKQLNLPIEYAYDIMMSIKNEKIKENIKKPILTLKEARQLLTYTKMNRKIIYDYRNYAIITLMITAGLSSYEIINLKREDYQIKGDKHVLIIKKNDSERQDIIYLSIGVVEAINDYLRKRKKENPYLFISQNHTTTGGHLSRTFFYFMFKKVIEKCGLAHTNITPHCLRHTSAYLNLLRGGSIESTKRLLRHVDIKSTLIYQEYMDKMNDHTEEKIEAFILNEASYDQDDYLFWRWFLR